MGGKVRIKLPNAQSSETQPSQQLKGLSGKYTCMHTQKYILGADEGSHETKIRNQRAKWLC